MSRGSGPASYPTDPLVSYQINRQLRSTVGVAVEFDIAAEWQGRQPPMGSKAIIEAKNVRSEAERESVDLNPTPAADQKMSELVKENHQAQDEKENALYIPRSPKYV